MLYHYTNGTKLEAIKKDGFIKAVPDITKRKEKPIAWLSSNSFFEKTANKVVSIGAESKLCNMEETAYYCNGLYRFAFKESALVGIYQWPRLSIEARIPDGIKKRLIKRAKKAGVLPSQWYGVLGSISIEDVMLEKWGGGYWTEVNLDNEIKKVREGGFSVESRSGMKRIPIEDSQWGDL